MYCLTEVISFCLSEKTLGIVFPAAFSFVNLGDIYLCPYDPEKYQSRSSSLIIINWWCLFKLSKHITKCAKNTQESGMPLMHYPHIKQGIKSFIFQAWYTIVRESRFRATLFYLLVMSIFIMYYLKDGSVL